MFDDLQISLQIKLIRIKFGPLSGTISPRFMEANKLLMELEYSHIKTNGIQLHVVQAGPNSGIPIMLLHGFPEFWYD